MHPLVRQKPDQATIAIAALLPPTRAYLDTGAPEYRPPPWVAALEHEPREIHLAGREGVALLEEWRAQSEAEMREILQGPEGGQWSLLRVLGILRRLPMGLAFLGEASEEGALRSQDPDQADAAEWIALKYATPDATGTNLFNWSKGPTGFVYDLPEVDLHALARMLAFTRLAAPQFAHLDSVRKTLTRGGEATHRPDGFMDARQRPDLERRFGLYDRRRKVAALYGSTSGTFRTPTGPDDPLGSVMYFERAAWAWREDEVDQPWRYERLGRWIPKSEKGFLCRAIPLRPIHEHLHLLEGTVKARYGLSPETIVAALMSLDRCMTIFLGAGFDYTNVEADRLIHLDRTGYLLAGDEILDTAVFGGVAHDAHLRAFPNTPPEADPATFAHAFKRLAYLDSYRPEDISLKDGHPWVRAAPDQRPTPMPRPFIYPAGPSVRIVDLHALGNFVHGLSECLSPSPAVARTVSTDLETRLGDFIGAASNLPRAFPPATELWRKIPGGRKERVAELDVSFKVGTVLVAIDAKSIPISPGYRAYDYGALKTRWEKFAGDAKHKGYVKAADEQADKISRHPSGTNYDLPAQGCTHVLTILCSPFPEYIDTEDPNYYLRDDLPRIATPPELAAFLSDTNEAQLKALPFTRRLARPGG